MNASILLSLKRSFFAACTAASRMTSRKNATHIVFSMSEAVLPQGYQGEGVILEGDIASTAAELEKRL